MTTTVLRCDRCRERIATVRDTRFGIAPSGGLCRTCTTPAWTRARAVAPLTVARAP